MPRFIRAQVRLHRNNGLPEDDAINVFHFDSDGDDIDTVMDHVDEGLEAYYNALEGYLSPVCSGAATVKMYDLSDPEPRLLRRTSSFTFQPNQVNGSLPADVALCATLLNTERVDMPIEYRRGRTYLGPLNATVAAGTYVGGDITVPQAVRDAFAAALEALAKRQYPPVGPFTGHTTLAVYSPTWHNGRPATSGGGPGGRPPKPALDAHPLDDSLNDVTEIRIDNQLDTQRRRGSKATARTTLAVT